jgi:hypothetical protein
MKVKELINVLNNYNPDDDVEVVGNSDGAVIQIGNYRPCVGLYGKQYFIFVSKDEITT